MGWVIATGERRTSQREREPESSRDQTQRDDRLGLQPKGPKDGKMHACGLCLASRTPLEPPEPRSPTLKKIPGRMRMEGGLLKVR